MQPLQDPVIDNEDSEEEYIDPEDIAQVIELDGEGPDFIDSDDDGNDIEEDQDQDSEELQEDVHDDSLKTFSTHQGDIYGVAFNSQFPSIFASAGGDDLAMLWDLSKDSKDPIHILKGHTDSVSQLSFSADGKYLATCGLDAQLKIWDPLTGELLHTFEGPTESVECCTWHSRGPVVFAGGGDGSGWMWNAATGDYMGVFSGHSEAIVSCCFTPDGKKIATASGDATIRVWDPKTAAILHVIKEGQSPIPWHPAPITVMKCHPEKDIVVTGGEDGHINVSNVGIGKIVGAFKGHVIEGEGEGESSIEDLEFLSFLPCVVSASLDKTVQIWDLNTLQTRTTLKHQEGAVRVRSCATNPHVLVTCCLDGSICVWDARTGGLINKFTGHRGPILDATVHGTTIITGSEDSTIKVWDMKIPS